MCQKGFCLQFNRLFQPEIIQAGTSVKPAAILPEKDVVGDQREKLSNVNDYISKLLQRFRKNKKDDRILQG
jgi:hypothetical protein